MAWVAAFAIAAGPAAVGAQSEPDEPTLDERIEAAERAAPRRDTDVESFSPTPIGRTEPVRPGLTEGVDWAALVAIDPGLSPTPRVLPERSFVVDVRGRVVDGPAGSRIFAPLPATDGRPLGAMLLLPSSTLERWDRLVQTEPGPIAAVVTGQVFLYDGRNYLLPTRMRQGYAEPPPAPEAGGPAGGPGGDAAASDAQALEDPAAGDAEGARADAERSDEPSPAEAEGQDPGRAIDAADPDVDALIAELEARPLLPRRGSGSGRAPAPAVPGGAGAPDSGANGAGANGSGAEPPLSDDEDGGYVRGLRGRIERAPDGTWAFLPDNFAPGEGPGMSILPCRLLHQIESTAMRRGDATAGLLSGRVFRYHGREYVLPTMFVLEHRDGVDPLQ